MRLKRIDTKRFGFRNIEHLVLQRFGRRGLNSLPRLKGLPKKRLKFPSFFISFSENPIIIREARYATRSLFFLTSSSPLKYRMDFSLPMNIKGLTPKIFTFSLFKEFILESQMKAKKEYRLIKSIIHTRMRYRIYKWKWIRQKFLLWKAIASSNYIKILKYSQALWRKPKICRFWRYNFGYRQPKYPKRFRGGGHRFKKFHKKKTPFFFRKKNDVSYQNTSSPFLSKGRFPNSTARHYKKPPFPLKESNQSKDIPPYPAVPKCAISKRN
jgi:hypothetical protein